MRFFFCLFFFSLVRDILFSVEVMDPDVRETATKRAASLYVLLPSKNGLSNRIDSQLTFWFVNVARIVAKKKAFLVIQE